MACHRIRAASVVIVQQCMECGGYMRTANSICKRVPINFPYKFFPLCECACALCTIHDTFETTEMGGKCFDFDVNCIIDCVAPSAVTPFLLHFSSSAFLVWSSLASSRRKYSVFIVGDISTPGMRLLSNNYCIAPRYDGDSTMPLCTICTKFRFAMVEMERRCSFDVCYIAILVNDARAHSLWLSTPEWNCVVSTWVARRKKEKRKRKKQKNVNINWSCSRGWGAVRHPSGELYCRNVIANTKIVH